MTSCSSTDDSAKGNKTADTTAESGTYAALLEPLEKSADDYLMAARLATPSKQPDILLLAARQFLQYELYQPANAVLFELREKEMSPIQQAGMRLLSAQILSNNKQYNDALSILQFELDWVLPSEYYKQYYQLRSELYLHENNPIAAAKALILLDDRLEDEAQLKQNHEQIWTLLKPYPASTLRTFVNAQAPDNERGWFELAAMSNEAMSSADELTEALRIWRTFYPNHPARRIMPESLEAALIAKPYAPVRIAILLPLSGKRQAHGEAIRDGIITAFFDNKESKWQPKLNFYDTESQSIKAIYKELIEMENEMIIGPLLRSNVTELLTLSPQVPILALNRIQAHQPQKDHYFFALSPEDEAQEVAKRISADGHQYPLVIAPSGAYGERVGTAFLDAWQALGHEPAELHQFDDQSKLQQTVQKMLGVSMSKNRIRQIGRIAGKLETEARSRRDVDSIYIIAKPIKARLIKPFIAVNLSPGTSKPDIYISSRSNGKNRSKESNDELNGVYMAEMPWMLSPAPKSKERTAKLWPRQAQALQRLYAMGYDSINLVPQLVQLKAFSGFKQSGLTGRLSIDANGDVKRSLSWTIFGSDEQLPSENVQGSNH